MVDNALFKSFFIGGFEGSTHRRLGDRRRLDLVASTRHDRFVVEDYARLQAVGMSVARDAVRWHMVEQTQGRYDWSSVLPMLRAARETGTQVVWDILHFGWPDDVDVFSPAFVDRFAQFARAFVEVLGTESDGIPFVAPINEPSFLSFSAGEKGFLHPFATGRGDEIKAQFVRAIIACCEAVWDACPQARIVHTDPMINIIADPRRPQDRRAAEAYRQSQFAVWDMIAGHAQPHLGGQEKYLDILGLNYYIQNQWIHEGGVLLPMHPQHLPFRYMLREVYERYSRPLFIAETGIEAQVRPDWLRYIGHEARAALRLSVPLVGMCIYPIVDHPGWNDDRYCPNGLWGYASETGVREIYAPLARELQRQQFLIMETRARELKVEPGKAIATGPESDVEAFEQIDWNIMNAAAHTMEDLATKRRE